MTTLITKIKADQLQARKLRENLKSVLLTTLIGEAEAIGKNAGNREVTDAEVVAVIKKFIKGIDETLKYLGDHAPIQRQVVKSEKDILEVYLPKQLNAAQLKIVVEEIKTVIPDVNKKMIMMYLKENYSGQYDGKLASAVIDEYLK